MRNRVDITSALLLGTLSASSTCRPTGEPRRAAVDGHEPSGVAPLLEDESGVLGGPRDETAFVFEPEPRGEDPPPLLEGTPEVTDAMRQAVAPYLNSRRVMLAGRPPPDGLLVLTRLDEVTQVYVVEDPLGPLRALTQAPEPVVQASYVASPQPWLLYRSDVGGDEDHQIFRFDLLEGRVQRLTDGRSRHGPFRAAPGGKRLAFTSNARRPADMDLLVRSIDARTDEWWLKRQGTWVVLGWSLDGRRLVVRRFRSVDDARIAIVDVESRKVRPIDADATEVNDVDARFGPSGLLYVASDRGRDAVGLFALDLDRNAWTKLTPDLGNDIEQFTVAGDRIVFTTNDDGYSTVWAMRTDGSDLRNVEEIPSGIVIGLRFLDATKLAFAMSTPTMPADAYTFDIEQRELTRWTDSTPLHLDRDSLVVPEIVRVRSFDDLEIPVLYYRPRGPGPFASIIWMHGGPEEQTRPGFSPMIQYFAANEIAVVAPNVRGSDGYGRMFRGLDNEDRRHDSVRDVGSVLDWIEARPDLDARRVGIHGASYGGYMVLASLVEYPERIRAGCDVVGVSNLVTFLENTRPYRRDLRRVEYGDERDPAMRGYLERNSPVHRAGEVRSALFVAHGANDPRVPVDEAEQIVAAVRDAGRPVWYMMAPNEGHGFRKRHNRDTFYALLAAFFAEHLAEVTDAPIDTDDATEQ